MFKLNERIKSGNGMIKITSKISQSSSSINNQQQKVIIYQLQLHLFTKSIQTHFSILKFKFINQKENQQMVQIDREIQSVYLLSYGGGLIIGDLIKLLIDLDEESCLGFTHSRFHKSSMKSKQILNVNLNLNSIFISLPSPITPYKSSHFKQTQSFHFSSPHASLLILDWLTTGRKHYCKFKSQSIQNQPKSIKDDQRGEEWDFLQFESINSFYLNHHLILKDSLTFIPSQTTSSSNQPFSIFATLYLITSPFSSNQTLHNLHDHFQSLQLQSKPDHLPHHSTSIPKQHSDLIWSYNLIQTDLNQNLQSEFKIGLIKLVSNDLIQLQDWIKTNLITIQDLIGLDLYQNAFQ
ncbi:UreD urease accessory protein-domain-containing protein [Melampsora americana]|nr:UreD urease accessory protein-domain-containing protein [Melampsora americana]